MDHWLGGLRSCPEGPTPPSRPLFSLDLLDSTFLVATSSFRAHSAMCCPNSQRGKIRHLILLEQLKSCSPTLFQDGNQQVFLLDIVQEIGARLRTVALVHKLRCVSVGPWSTKQVSQDHISKHYSTTQGSLLIPKMEFFIKADIWGWSFYKYAQCSFL